MDAIEFIFRSPFTFFGTLLLALVILAGISDIAASIRGRKQ